MTIQRVKGKRGRAKASLSLQSVFAENINDSTTLAALEIHLSRLNEAWSDFNALSDQMYQFVDDPGYVDPEPEFEEYESKYLKTHAILTTSIRDKTPLSEPAPALNVASITESLSAQQIKFLKDIETTKASKSVQLPKLVVPTFNGDYKDWPGFKDIFMGTIDSNTTLNGTQKFQYLKSFLGKKPAELFKNTPCTEKNYLEAWDELEERYDKTNLIIQSFIQTFLSMPSLKGKNATLLRTVFDQADEVIRGLNSCLEACGPLESSSSKQTISDQKGVRSHMVETSTGCPNCKEDHFLSACKSFCSLSLEARREFVKENNLCFNCFRSGHSSNRCRFNLRCKLCNKRHNTLVHPTENLASTTSAGISSSVNSSVPTNLNCHSLESSHHLSTLLPTAVVMVQDKHGAHHKIRVLLDTGSQVSFVTEQVVQCLGLLRTPSRIPIMGVASTSAGVTNGVVTLNLFSRFDNNNIEVDCYVISKLTLLLPPAFVPHSITKPYMSLELADPSFNKPGHIDILIGADRVFDVIKFPFTSENIDVPNCIPTMFGLVIAGNIEQQRSFLTQEFRTFCTQIDFSQEFDLERFWRLEEVHSQSSLSLEEQQAEEHFVATHERTADGRYIVHLPFKPNFNSKLCNSFGIALNRLRSMERRFIANPDLKTQYLRFLNEYRELGHMEEIPQNEIEQQSSECYYFPHHAVLKNNSSTTKLRVVFHGSAKPHQTDKSSLNELLLVGPTIQHDIFTICLRSRRHVFVISGDIEKMFRQILVSPKDANYQRIIWRSSAEEPLKHFKLLTVTYGTSAAPFLSVRTLKQLALDYEKTYPRASNVILNDFYVDDVFTGADSIDDIIYLQKELVEILKLGGFNLRKWTTNCWPLLLSLPQD
ncbi:uncharacterized protein LOC129953645 [Eupeodes corollae]|uniref:uncharacterized protein LOC129953645 n=1 Tax=Eupeodes corollae TaxID=290404 RepID=UPI002493CC35|nr:uncharacterized protein LOC129953645 [Eupeodes corollae]